jgi:hypothetical protein
LGSARPFSGNGRKDTDPGFAMTWVGRRSELRAATVDPGSAGGERVREEAEYASRRTARR